MNREEHGQARAGKLTGSLIQRIMVGGYKAWNSVAKEMRNPRPFFHADDTPNMPAPLKWGQQNEAEAAANFWERHPEFEIADPKFVPYTGERPLFREYLGVSPDRVLMSDGAIVSGLEIKCPWDGEVHVATIKAGVVPATCRWQVYHEMLVTGASEWWFLSYDPRATDPDWRYFELRVTADPDAMAQLERTITEFLEGYISGQEFSPRAKTAADFDLMFR